MKHSIDVINAQQQAVMSCAIDDASTFFALLGRAPSSWGAWMQQLADLDVELAAARAEQAERERDFDDG